MLSYYGTSPHPVNRQAPIQITGDDLSQAVLVVDDEPMARTLLRLMLVRAGYEVFEAEDGYDALIKSRCIHLMS